MEANLAGARLLGGDREKIHGTPFSAFVAEDNRDVFRNHCLKVLAGGEKTYCEVKMIRKDGSSFYISMESIGVADGQRGKILAVVTDITERKRGEEPLREAHERVAWLARFSEENPSPVARASAEGVLLYRNRGLGELLGWECEVGQPLPAPLLTLVGRAMREGKEAAADVELSGRFFSVSATPFPVEGYVNLYGRDITASKEAAAVIQRYHLLASRSRDIILFVRRNDGKILEANDAAVDAYGYTREELLKLSIHDLRAPETKVLLAEQMAEADLRGILFETVHRCKDGRVFPVEVSSRGAAIDGTRMLISVVRDITERRRMVEELRRSRDELELRIQERTQELAKSHQRLQMLSSQLLQAQEKERKRVAVELHDGLLSELAAMKILFEAKLKLLENGNLSDLSEFKKVSDILAVVMKEARGIINNLRPSILDELGLIAAINWWSGEYQKLYSHIKVQKQIEVSEQGISDSIKIVIYRVLQEAFNNFAKHGKGDLVDLSLLKSNNTLALMIRDNGQGFDLEKEQKGLGLESMQERVELSGGEFKIESGIGQGTTIRATWSFS